MTATDLEQQKARFWTRTRRFEAHGYDRLRAPAVMLDEAAPIDGPVLDFGTGLGVTAMALARRGLDVVSVGLKADDQRVAAALAEDASLSDRIRFEIADGKSLSFPDGSFGAAVAIDVLHHLDDGRTVLHDLLRVVRPGGVIFLAEFSPEGFRLVSAILAEEGRSHEQGPVTLDWVRGYLGGLGVTEERTWHGHLHRMARLRKAATAGSSAAFAALDRAGLLKALDVFARNWLAHDGCWFLAAEERYGLEAAIQLDAASWQRFAEAEARRIVDAFSIAPGGALERLAQALGYRMYSFINPWRIERAADGSWIRFHMESCRVQDTRRRKGLPDFPCQPVGQVEFQTFARAVDRRIVATCLRCPPQPEAEGRCSWEFRLSDESAG